MKLVPFPSSLSTLIFPPFASTKSLHRKSPKPVPASLFVPCVVKCSSFLKSLFRFSLLIPIPVSITEIRTESFFISDEIVTFPSLGVNLSAFPTKFRKITSI